MNFYLLSLTCVLLATRAGWSTPARSEPWAEAGSAGEQRNARMVSYPADAGLRTLSLIAAPPSGCGGSAARCPAWGDPRPTRELGLGVTNDTA
jgi:hypothetical protein